MQESRKQPFTERLRERRGLESLQAHVLGLQDVRLICGDELVIPTPVMQSETHVAEAITPSWHLKPGADVLRAMHRVAEASQPPSLEAN